MFLFRNIQAIFPIQELNHRAVRVTNRGVIFNLQAFHSLYKTSLKIARPRRLDCGIYQSFSTGHSMKVILLWSYARQITINNVTTGSDVRLMWSETGQRLAANHDWDSTSLQNLLT